MIILILFLVFCVVLNINIQGRECGHHHVIAEQKKVGFTPHKQSSIDRRDLEQSEWEPIRVLIDYTNLDASGDVTSSQKAYIKEYVGPEAKKAIESLLQVKRIDGNLIIDRPNSDCEIDFDGKCEESTAKVCYSSYDGGDSTPRTFINKEHMEVMEVCPDGTPGSCGNEGGGAEETDFIVYMNSGDFGICDSSSQSGTIAFAGTCVEDDDNDGIPVAGHCNYCPHMIDASATDKWSVDKVVRVVVHELFHALGFTEAYFHSRLGLPDDFNFRERTKSGDNNIFKLTSDKALETARKHFGCDDLNGLEIESQESPGDGTFGSHTEERIFYGDLMNGVMPAHPTYSHISLSIMEDLGWYMPQYENAETLWFGNNATCDFAMNKCILGTKDEPKVNGPDFHYCVDESKIDDLVNLNLHCTADRRGIGACAMSSWSSIPEDYQYFTDPTSGGPIKHADFCPMYLVSDIADLLGTVNGDCYDSSNNPQGHTMHGEVYGYGSRCFMSTLQNTAASEELAYARGRCHNYTCIYYGEEENGALKGVDIFLDGYGWNRQLKCYSGEGDKKKPAGGTWLGTLICPSDAHLIMLCPKLEDGSASVLGPAFSDPPNWLEEYWYVVFVIGIGVLLLIILLALCFFAICGCRCYQKRKPNRA